MSKEFVKVSFSLEPGSLHGVATERLWAAPVGAGQYRIENSPFYAFGVSYQDIVLATGTGPDLVFAGIVKRGGHSTYRVIVQQQASFAKFWAPLQDLKCTYEQGHGTLLAVDVPPSTNIFDAYALLRAGEDAGAWTFEEGHCGHSVA